MIPPAHSALYKGKLGYAFLLWQRDLHFSGFLIEILN